MPERQLREGLQSGDRIIFRPDYTVEFEDSSGKTIRNSVGSGRFPFHSTSTPRFEQLCRMFAEVFGFTFRITREKRPDGVALVCHLS